MWWVFKQHVGDVWTVRYTGWNWIWLMHGRWNILSHFIFIKTVKIVNNFKMIHPRCVLDNSNHGEFSQEQIATVVCSAWQSVYVRTYLAWQNSKHAVLCTWLITPLPTITMSISGNLKRYCVAAQPTGNIRASLLPYPWEQSSFFISYKGLHVLPHLITAAMLRYDKRTFCIIRSCWTDPKMYLKSCVLKLGWNVTWSAKQTHSLQNVSGNTV